MQDLLPQASADDLRALARQSAAITQACNCRAADSATLVRDPYDEPTFAEYHPDGTRYASPDAPIALRYHPFNRCNVARCTQCARHYLRYVEAGGYFVDRRIRALDDAALVSDPD
jgi:hypothetical protein